MRVLVCGSRNYDPLKVVEWLNEYYRDRPTPERIIEGGASGADMGGRYWAIEQNIQCDTYPADWKRYGKSAGPLRNQEMLREGKPELVIAFLAKDSIGTRHMIEIAEKAGVKVVVIPIGSSLQER